MDDSSLLFIGMLYGAVGFGFITYGVKQKVAVPLLVGVALSALPYVISNMIWLIIVGVVLLALPYFVRV